MLMVSCFSIFLVIEGFVFRAVSYNTCGSFYDVVAQISVAIDVGQGVKAKVSKMAKESIKVERSETSKKIYEE